ncbi:MAG: hypothetical protein H8D92_01545 [Pelagibacteraceae bacterium]|nr:hypothetical protein [Pelagibacteraceae bacterium]
MLKTLFNLKYSKKFLDRIEFRRAEYYEKRRVQTIRNNAMKMAMNWSHEYPTGTPLEYIRDDIIECWERTAGVGIYSGLDKKQNIPTTPSAIELQWTGSSGFDAKEEGVTPTRKYVHNWRNPPDEDKND